MLLQRLKQVEVNDFPPNSWVFYTFSKTENSRKHVKSHSILGLAEIFFTFLFDKQVYTRAYSIRKTTPHTRAYSIRK